MATIGLPFMSTITPVGADKKTGGCKFASLIRSSSAVLREMVTIELLVMEASEDCERVMEVGAPETASCNVI